MTVGAHNRSKVFIPTRHSLLNRLRNLDDEISWRDFFDTYWKLIYNAAIQSGLTDDEAQDVVQETILTVARNIRQFDYDPALGSFKGWLLHTTRWRILDQLRKRHPGFSQQNKSAAETALMANVPDLAFARLEAAWDEEWQQNLMDAAIQRVKRRVQPKHYQIFELRTLKEWPARKVARTLGVNVAQVHLIKHRVGTLIKREIKQLEERGL
jgi:RNA polymerase sigma factor (sigma-70 family)